MVSLFSDLCYLILVIAVNMLLILNNDFNDMPLSPLLLHWYTEQDFLERHLRKRVNKGGVTEGETHMQGGKRDLSLTKDALWYSSCFKDARDAYKYLNICL